MRDSSSDIGGGGQVAALDSVIRPKRPNGPGWRAVSKAGLPLRGTFDVWAHDGNGLCVFSAVEVAAEEVGKPALGPAYHLSVSAFGERCSGADALWVLAQFDLLDAEEDNHVPGGKMRNFWRYVADNLVGVKCACVADEPAIREDKGDYVWRGVTNG